MNLSPRVRIVIISTLLVGYTPALFLELRGETPLYEDYESHVGETVDDLNGIVISTDPVKIAIADNRMQLTVRDMNTAVSPGDKIRIFGVIRPERVIEAENAIVTAQSSTQLRTYLISFVAGVWVVYRIIRDFTLDWNNWALVPAEIQQESRD